MSKRMVANQPRQFWNSGAENGGWKEGYVMTVFFITHCGLGGVANASLPVGKTHLWFQKPILTNKMGTKACFKKTPAQDFVNAFSLGCVIISTIATPWARTSKAALFSL